MKEGYQTKVIDNSTTELAGKPVKNKLTRYSFPGESFTAEAESVEDAVKQLQDYKEAQTK